jgi:hypothetical protein
MQLYFLKTVHECLTTNASGSSSNLRQLKEKHFIVENPFHYTKNYFGKTFAYLDVKKL